MTEVMVNGPDDVYVEREGPIAMVGKHARGCGRNRGGLTRSGT